MFVKALKWEKIRRVLLYALYLLFALLLQSLLFSGIKVLGVRGFILPAAAVGAGMYLGGTKGAVFGLILGVFSDLSFTDSTVLYTLLFSLIGFGAGFASDFFLNKSFPAFMVFSTAALLLTAFMQFLIAVILHGAELIPGLMTVLLQVALSVLPAMLLYLPFRDRAKNSKKNKDLL